MISRRPAAGATGADARCEMGTRSLVPPLLKLLTLAWMMWPLRSDAVCSEQWYQVPVPPAECAFFPGCPDSCVEIYNCASNEYGGVWCSSDSHFCDGDCAFGPKPEICDGLDNDMDGDVDEGMDCPQKCDAGHDCAPAPTCGPENPTESSNGRRGDKSSPSCPGEETCSPVLVGDPFTLGFGESYFRSEDAFLDTGAQKLALTRTYVSADESWSRDRVIGDPTNASKLPTPFGRTGGDKSLRWVHNYFTFVGEGTSELVWRGPAGQSVRFDKCSTAPCRALPRLGEGRVKEQLNKTSTGYEVLLSDGTRLVYESKEKSTWRTLYFLSRALNATGATLFSAVYANPTGCTQSTGSDPGVPYLSRIIATGGTTAELVLGYTSMAPLSGVGANECVLTSVSVKDAAGALSTVTTYAYSSSKAGLLAQATVLGQPLEVYSYSPNFSVTRAGLATVTQSYSSGAVTNENNLTQNLTVGYVDHTDPATPRPACTSCCPGATTRELTVADSDAQPGDGSGTSATLSTTYRVSANSEQHRRPRVYEKTDACSHGAVPARNVCSAGTEKWEWECAAGSTPGYEKAQQDKRGSWRVWDKVSSPANADVLELRRVRGGATDSNGTGALSDTAYSYEYGAGNKQLMKSEAADSGYGPNTAPVVTTFGNDLTKNRAKNEITCGKTQTFSTAGTGGFSAQISKCRGTFYFDTRPRSGMNTADPFGRTLEVHGPCWVTSASSSDCDDGSAYPVTQYEYYGASEVLNKANRLKATRTYPSATVSSLGAALETLIEGYDAEGKPTQTRDENGIVTTTTYANGYPNVVTTNVGGSSTRAATYTYENGKLVSAKNPDGSFDVYCYRVGAAAGCSSSYPWSDQLQWRAKASSADGTTWSDRVQYEYWPDGTVSKETYEVTHSGLAGGGTATTKVLQFAADAHRRPTLFKFGNNPSTQYSTWAKYDGNDNRVGLGPAYNAPPAFCDNGSGGLSTNCNGMEYDRLDRVQSLMEHPTTSSQVRTCFKYDTRGNVIRVSSCQAAAGTTCEANFTTGCLAMASEYLFDDFGNLVEATLPNTGSTGSAMVTRFAYDARGNLTHKQTPEQARTGSGKTAEFTNWTHDLLDRPLQARGYSNSGSSSWSITNLWTREYDTSSTSSTCGTASNAKGRLAAEWNSQGFTVFAYNPWGQATNELRYRPAPNGGSCPNNGLNDRPSTTYVYDAVGRLARIDYPYGRQVTYGYYPEVERAHLVRQVWLRLTSTWYHMVDNVRWSHGELTGYQIQTPSTPALWATVEYLQGEAGSTSGFLTRPTSSDNTGRLRSILVSSGNTWTGAGDIFHRTHRWSGEQLAQHQTRYLNQPANTFTQSFDNGTTKGYDQVGRLKNLDGTSSLSGGAGGAGGYPASRRAYAFDARGNRNSEFVDGCGTSSTFTYASPLHQADQLRTRAACNPNLLWNYDYDLDGRVTKKYTRTDSSLTPAWQVSLGYGPSSTSGGDSMVAKTVSVNSAAWTYYYDPKARRTIKASAVAGIDDEYFYLGDQNQLLQDRGNWDVASKFGTVTGSGAPLDEYIWLGGRPIAFIRSKFDSTWTRQPDLTGTCQRDGEAMACGLYFIVNDHIGQPVLLLDLNRRIAQALETEPGGYVNRIQKYEQTAIPYADNTNAYLGWFNMQTGANLSAWVRPVFNMLDVEGTRTPLPACKAPSDYLRLEDQWGGTVSFVGGGPAQFSGYHATGGGPGTTWGMSGRYGGWSAVPVGNWMRLHFVSDSSNCSPCAGCKGECKCEEQDYQGAILEAWDYRRFENSANQSWTPLRLPGQYHDEETDLFENWNRLYDPPSGRYLQPEPILADPFLVAAMAKQGHSLPPYAYGLNNPIHYTDPNGKSPTAAGAAAGAAVGGPVGAVVGAGLATLGAGIIAYCATHPGACPTIGPVCKDEAPPDTPRQKCERIWTTVFNGCMARTFGKDLGGCLTLANNDPAYKACMKNLPN